MKTSQKIYSVIFLNIVFALVLGVIYWLTKDRMDYASAALMKSIAFDEVSDYRMISRSIKYGMILVSLTFGVFFLFELLKDLRIHLMQYILVGAALSIFYLLLLSFSEIIGFNAAYFIASAACISLIVWYLQFVLHNWTDIGLVGGLLVSTYGVMYVLLSMSEMSLVIGSVLLFFALFGVMYCTRNVDWYAIGGDKEIVKVKVKVKEDKGQEEIRDFE